MLSSVTEITEGFEYQVAFKAGGKEFCMHVTLTKDFPNEKPILKVAPVIIHPWINADGEITAAPGLLNVCVIFKQKLKFIINCFYSLLYILILDVLFKLLYVKSKGMLHRM